MPSLNTASTSHQPISHRQISDNFTLAKFLAIVLVSTGHYFHDTLIWVPVTVGLFIFGFSSGYFTALKHQNGQSLKGFWLAKLKRLGPPLIVINLFLGALFLIEGRAGLWHPHTLLGITGMSGLLNWFGIPNQSPYGAGLWFMTVLLLFYLVYPFLAKSLKSSTAALVFIVISGLVCTLGHLYASPPYMLWPTVFGFCLGAAAGSINWQPSAKYSLVAGTITVVTALGLNAIGIKQFNMLAVVTLSIASTAFLLCFPLKIAVSRISLLSGSILEIYLIHSYLFIRPSAWPEWTGYLASMMLVLIVSVILHSMAQLLNGRLMVSKAPIPVN